MGLLNGRVAEGGAEGCGPRGDREPGPAAGHERAQEEKDDGGDGKEPSMAGVGNSR
jgi:hypothetical protein